MSNDEKAQSALPEPEALILRDATRVIIRPIRPDDAPRLQALHSRLSPATIVLRFLALRTALPRAEADRLANVDYRAQMAFVATSEETGEELVIGVARYAVIRADQPDHAEAALLVEDRFQRHGLGTRLAERLRAYARAQGIRAFVAEVSAENDRMMTFIRRTGLPTVKKLESGVWQIEVRLEGEANVGSPAGEPP